MKIKKIILNNIRSYSREEIEFPEGSILLSGDIGSGKTSVLLGIEFGLFGLQPGQKGSSLLKNGTDNGSVILEFETEGKNVLIERALKRGKTISQDACSITINGEKKVISVMELKSAILEILEYPKEFSKKQNLLYKFTVYTPQEEMKEIINEDSETRVNTLRHIFGIDKYKRIIENSAILTSKLREEKRLREGMVSNMEKDREELISKETELADKLGNLVSVEKELFLKSEEKQKKQEEKDSAERVLEEKRKTKHELDKINILISGKTETISNNQKTAEILKNQIKELEEIKVDESEINGINNKIKSKREDKENLNKENAKISFELNSLSSRIKELEDLKSKISNLQNCPTCLQEVHDLYKNNILERCNSEIKTMRIRIELLNNEKKKTDEEIIISNSVISELEKQLNEKNNLRLKIQTLSDKKSRLLEIENSDNLIQKGIDLLKLNKESFETSLSDFDSLKQTFENKQKEFEFSVREERIAEIKVAELKREIEVFSKQIESFKEKIKKTEEIQKKLNYIIELENWISKNFVPLISHIEKNVMIKLKTEFSELFSNWFTMLVSETFNAKLDDNFTPVIEQQDYEIDYSYLSGGERTAVALAYRLALNQLINSLLSKIKTRDIVILDEPTDGFSNQQLDKMRDVLSQLNVKQLILVSHEPKMESFVDHVIKFNKIDGISVKEQ
jgi:exonuclease SbcC